MVRTVRISPKHNRGKKSPARRNIERFVKKYSGEFISDGSGDYKLGDFHFRTYPGREGYDEEFLGESVALPKLDKSIAHQAAHRIDEPDKTELEYTHFSIVQNKMRRMPFFTAVNIDGESTVVEGGKAKWRYEGRILPKHQLGNIAYTKNDIDRGHMVHGVSPAWGEDSAQARADSYVYTNVALQHKALNQGKWLDLENQILKRVEAKGQKCSVFAGPVFQKSDRHFTNGGRIRPAVKMPEKFWKVVVWNDPDKGLQSESYIMSQKKDLKRKGRPPRYKRWANLSPYRVPLSEIERQTKLDFEDLAGSDTYKRPPKNSQSP